MFSALSIADLCDIVKSLLQILVVALISGLLHGSRVGCYFPFKRNLQNKWSSTILWTGCAFDILGARNLDFIPALLTSLQHENL